MIPPFTSHFCQQLKINLPIIQAPMAGGIITPALIAAVNQSGGLGSLPLGYLSLDDAQSAIRKTAAVTSAPFAVNIFIPAPASEPLASTVNNMLSHVNRYRTRLGLPAYSEIPEWAEPDLEELIEMIVTEKISIISFTFGMLTPNIIKKLHQNNIFVIGTATTVEEGLALESVDCDAVVAQGAEAGGHRGGGFLASSFGGFISTMSLVPQMVNRLRIPVIASGGIMNGQAIVTALDLGASAVQMGTALLTCDESTASPMHKRMLLEHPEHTTTITSVFTGKPVRCINNEFVRATEKNFSITDLLPYPLQHQITKEMRAQANKLNDAHCAGLWSGQGNGLCRALSVKNLMSQLEEEMTEALPE